MPLSLSIVTAERTVLERDDVDRLIVPTTEGQITILPSHAALMASLAIGQLTAITREGATAMAVHGGFIQVVNDQVTVLADAAERPEDIDEARAEAARQRAEQRLAMARDRASAESIDFLRAQLSMQRSLLRLRMYRTHRNGVPSARA